MALDEKLKTFDSAKKVGGLFDEFKNFAFKGNVVDLAIGVIIGAAFGTIVKSLVDNIIMPVISLVIPGEKGYEHLQWVLAAHEDSETHKIIIDKAINYGRFLADVLNFVIVAFVLFLFIKKFLGWLMRAKKEEAAAPPMTKDQELLVEIRDLLKQQTAGK
jgi:large conductance mechanosensitive channel